MLPSRVSTPLFFSVLLAVVALTASASATDYAALAEQAKASFEPITAEEVESARADLASRAVALERRLNPESEFGAGWLEYLEWSGVQKQLAAGSEVDIDAARRTLTALGSGAEGLESPVFQETADALERYLGVARFSRARDQQKTFGGLTDALAGVLGGDRLGDSVQSYEAERRLLLMERVGIGQELVSAARRDHGQPNILVEVGSDLLGTLANQMVTECGPVEDCILGTAIRGTGYTSGHLTVSTLPAEDRARLAFALQGSTDSSTRGVNGPVAIYSTGQTHFTAHKIVELSDRKFRLLPSTASATTRTKTGKIEKIGGGLFSGIIERIASDRVAEKKPQADAIAADHAEDRISRKLDDRLAEKIREARRGYDDHLTKPLRRRRASPRTVHQRTTDDALHLSVVQAGTGQLAASGEAPAAVEGELSARIHQSAANNLLAAYLGGATLRRDEQDEKARLEGRVTPEWLTPDADEPTRAPREDVDFEPYRLRFRSGRPVSFSFEDGLLRAVVHVARLQVDGDRYDGWDLIMTFRPEQADGRWKLLREGEVEVLPTGFDPESGEKLPNRQVALRGNLAKALNDPADRLPQEIRIDPIDLDPEAKIDLLAMQRLRFEDGWAVMSWDAE